jgi:hypothetical protein
MDHTCAVKLTSLLTLLLVGLLASACGKKIGDGCKTNIDCAQDGTRICDLSMPGGYCTQDGCDETSCPSESICVRFFSQKYSAAPGPDGECRADQLLVACGATPDVELCCVPTASERRYCAEKCGNDGDCRGGYLCRASGTNGSIALLDDPAASQKAKFCAPIGN